MAHLLRSVDGVCFCVDMGCIHAARKLAVLWYVPVVCASSEDNTLRPGNMQHTRCPCKLAHVGAQQAAA
jgi:hypothetical protein